MDRKREDEIRLLESWLDFGDLMGGHPELQRLLYDPVTGLPTTPLLFPRIAELLAERGEVSFLCVNVTHYSHIEGIYGWQTLDGVMREVARALGTITGTALRETDAVAELMISGSAFVVVLSPPRAAPTLAHQALAELVHRVEAAVRDELEQSVSAQLYHRFGCHVGSATVTYHEDVRIERLVYEGLVEGLAAAGEREHADAQVRLTRLREILLAEDISTVVLPIFDLSTSEVIGYEALARGPEGTEFELPEKLFTVAYDTELLMRLERICRTRAFEAAEELPAGRRLFVNIEPDAVGDPQLREVLVSEIAEERPPIADRVVIELTERVAVSDFAAFRSTLEYLRTLGFSVAVDDAGAGYGSLNALAEVHPEWLKVDMGLVRGCDTDDVRARLIESLVLFAQRVGSKLIAEGIETEGELNTLRRCGVRYGQGFLLGGPAPPFPDDASLPGTALL